MKSPVFWLETQLNALLDTGTISFTALLVALHNVTPVENFSDDRYSAIRKTLSNLIDQVKKEEY